MIARIVSTRTDAEVALADAFGSAKATLPGNAAVRQMRETAFGAFAATGLPNRRIEAWHYTDLRSLMPQALPLAPEPGAAALEGVRAALAAAELPAGPRLVMVDGTFVPSLSDAAPAGVTIRSLADVLAEGRADLIEKLSAQKFGSGDAVLALNAALMQDGVVIEVAAGVESVEPIHILYATASSAPVARFFRSLVVVGQGAKVRVAESSLGQGGRTGQTFGCLIFDVADHGEGRATAAP